MCHVYSTDARQEMQERGYDVPDAIRTHDLLLRRQPLYPAELPELHDKKPRQSNIIRSLCKHRYLYAATLRCHAKIHRILAAHKRMYYNWTMDRKIYDTIKERLLEVEKEHKVKILYAVESGSRSWGIESTNSDYDVRFIYVHDKNWYLNILPKKDVIEYPIVDEFDYAGWDLRKTLFLANKSNPVLFEWLKSPIIYYKDNYFYDVMEQLSQEYFSPISSVYHYLHMARGNYRQFLQTDKVKIKKYFYVLRPLMACMWIEKYKESPPVEFEKLLTQITEKELLDEITDLLKKKKSGIELGLEPRRDRINDFIEKILQHFEDVASSFDPKKKPKQKILEEGFIGILDYMEKQRDIG